MEPIGPLATRLVVSSHIVKGDIGGKFFDGGVHETSEELCLAVEDIEHIAIEEHDVSRLDFPHGEQLGEQFVVLMDVVYDEERCLRLRGVERGELRERCLVGFCGYDVAIMHADSLVGEHLLREYAISIVGTRLEAFDGNGMYLSFALNTYRGVVIAFAGLQVGVGSVIGKQLHPAYGGRVGEPYEGCFGLSYILQVRPVGDLNGLCCCYLHQAEQ